MKQQTSTSNLTNRSKIFLKKLKAQSGLQVPYQDIPGGQDQFMDYYSMQAPQNIEQNLQPNLEAAKKSGQIKYTPSLIQDPSLVQTNPNSLDAAYAGQGSGENTASDISRKIGAQGIPFLSNWTKSLVGGWDFIKSFQDKKNQKAFERNSKADLKQRKDQARSNNFYMTPYTAGSTSDYTLKEGGLIKSKYQMGGNINPVDAFMDYYNKQQDMTQMSIQQLQQGYEEKNKALTNQWKQRRSEGLAQHLGAGAASFGEYMKTFGGGMGGGAGGGSMQQGGEVYIPTLSNPSNVNSTATPLMPQRDTLKEAQQRLDAAQRDREQFASQDVQTTKQVYKMLAGVNPENLKIGTSKNKFRYREKQEGGEISSDNEDLYSANFQSPWANDNESSKSLENKLKVDNPDVSLQNNSNMQQWLFEDEPVQKYTTNDIYFKIFGEEQESEQELPIQPIVDKLSQMGLKPSSINTGQHNEGSLHGKGRAVDLGINTTFGGDQNKMNEFYNYLTSTEGRKEFPNIKIRDERTRPEGQPVWNGSHLHLELTD